MTEERESSGAEPARGAYESSGRDAETSGTRRTIVEVRHPPLGRSLREFRQAAELISGADLPRIDSVQVFETTRKEISGEEFEQLVDRKAELDGVRRLAELESPRSDLSLDEIVADVAGRLGETSEAVAEKTTVVVVVFGPIIVVVFPYPGPIIILGW